ncbi:MAG: membrane dipeptidase [Eubacteriales bacterium]|nr:membrane dipeptidase [Clostridiales bacterium]MDY5835641.1 membrane dipeptidase [Eubacteriales bacterium]
MEQLKLTKAQEYRAQDLCAKNFFFDCLCGNLIDPEPPVIDGKSYLDRCLESGVNAQSITLTATWANFEEVLFEMYNYFNYISYFKDKLMLVKSKDDLQELRHTNKLGVVFSLQNSIAIGSDFYKWSILKNLGLRICQLTYNEPNIMGSGCTVDVDTGLTYYGKQAIREMKRQGIVVDLSHAGMRTSLEAIEYNENPSIFSHSNCRAVTPDARRNLTDDVIEAVAKKGGVIGLSPHGFMCHSEVGVQPTLEDYMKHFEYLLNKIGPKHIGIGSDIYEYYTKSYWENKTKLLYNSPWFFETVFNRDVKRVDQYINIIRGLVYLGLNDEEIADIMGLNFLRVFEHVWVD